MQNELINEQVTLQISLKNIWKINQKLFTMLRREKKETAREISIEIVKTKISK